MLVLVEVIAILYRAYYALYKSPAAAVSIRRPCKRYDVAEGQVKKVPMAGHELVGF